MRETKNSGQIIIIAAFVIATLLLSAELYVFNVAKTTNEIKFNSLNDFALAVKLGSQHVVVSSLANSTNGGIDNILMSNLERWTSFVSSEYDFGKSSLNCTAGDTAPYSSGLWINWGSNGYGVSSAYAEFTYTLTDQGASITMPYSVNITTTLFVQSTSKTIQANETQVNVTINLLNEGKAALAKQILVRYKDSNTWLFPNNYVILDHGNGTYFTSFTANIPLPTVEVSAKIVDQRDIFAQANTTSTQI